MTAHVKHPGKTPAQCRVLDEIGCGNFSPFMSKATRDKLLADGLIEELSPLILLGPLPVRVRQFQMPIAVHMDWCAAVAEETP